jgi:choline kinase
MIFTKEILRRMATLSSFERGESYYEEGHVSKITIEGTKFKATVSGSSRYKVQLDLKNGEPDFRCSCPYDLEGICKHSVALGLAVLEEGIPKTLTAEITAPTSLSEKAFEELFSKTADSLKLGFLRQLLSQDAHLQQQFQAYTTPEKKSKKKTDETSLTDIFDRVSEDVSAQLSDAVFDENFYEDHHGRNYYDYYDDEGTEQFYEAIDSFVEEGIGVYLKKAETAFLSGKLNEALAYWTGIYEGMMEADEPAEDDFSVFDNEDYHQYLAETFSEKLADFVKKVSLPVFTETELKTALTHLVDRYDEDTDEDDEYEYISFDLTDFEPLLKALTVKPGNAAFLYQLLESRKLINTGTSPLAMHLMQITGNNAGWVKMGEKFYKEDKAIAERLLEYYRTEPGKRADFLRVLKSLFNLRPYEFAGYAAQHITPEEDLSTFRTVFFHLVRNGNDFENYRRLQPHLSAAERQSLITEFSKGYRTQFYIQMLHAEKQHQQLWNWLKEQKSLAQLQKILPEATRYLTEIFPEEVLDWIVKKADNELAAGQRGTDYYTMIAQSLAELKKNKQVSKAVSIYAHKLLQTYSRLNALKNQLKVNGVL